ncbi:MAG: type II toxin-antitoxin system RelE/ParE family toxin [Inhella sp.]
MQKKVRLRLQAEADLLRTTQFSAEEGGVPLAGRCFDTAPAALEPIARMPAMASPRLGQLCEIPGLRCWRVTDFPLQWLYFEAADHLDMVRLLGDRQDTVATLTTTD